MKRVVFAAIAAMCLLMAVPAFAQTPAPATSTMAFSVGAGAFGISATSNATPATDVTLSLNPGIAKLPNFSFRSDNVLAPGAGMQFYGGGVDYRIPYLAKTGLFSQIYFTVNGTFGIDRIVPATGPSQANFGFMVGGTVHYVAGSVDLNLFQAGLLHTPGAAWGSNAPYIGGSVTKTLFGNQPAAVARLQARSQTVAQNFTPTW